jgi:hypothetical protein
MGCVILCYVGAEGFSGYDQINSKGEGFIQIRIGILQMAAIWSLRD